jgi:nitroimidazol reductase NimA-like FMN-containing flavoprotein (pyridoxamine 5'-phosphate oxidase superfamily)
MPYPPREIEERYRKLMEDASHFTLATASPEGEPEAAVMAFAAGPGFCLYFYTLNDSRKYRNLNRNPKAALTLYSAPEYAQLDGEVRELSGAEAEAAQRAILEHVPGDRKGYHRDPRCRYFLFRPARICLRVDEGYPSKYEAWHPQEGDAPRLREL